MALRVTSDSAEWSIFSNETGSECVQIRCYTGMAKFTQPDAGSMRSREQSGRGIRLHPNTARQRELHPQHTHTAAAIIFPWVMCVWIATSNDQLGKSGQLDWVHVGCTQDYTDDLNKLLALTLCSHCLSTDADHLKPRDHSLAPSADHKISNQILG